MKSKFWIKLWHDTLHDPKMGSLPDYLWRRTIECFLLAGELDCEGLLPDIDTMIWVLRTQKEQLESELLDLQSLGFLQYEDGQWTVINFVARQAPMSNSERAKKYREKLKAEKSSRSWKKKILYKLPESMGIYQISCNKSEKVYIGASKNIKKRVGYHLTEMLSDRSQMSDDFHTFGHQSFEATVVELVDDMKTLGDAELKHINSIPRSMLYNNNTAHQHHLWLAEHEPNGMIGTRSEEEELKEEEEEEKDIKNANFPELASELIKCPKCRVMIYGHALDTDCIGHGTLKERITLSEED